MKSSVQHLCVSIWRALDTVYTRFVYEENMANMSSGLISIGFLVCLLKSLVMVVIVLRRLFMYPSSRLYACLHCSYICVWWMKHVFGWNPSRWDSLKLGIYDIINVTGTMMTTYTSLPLLISRTQTEPHPLTTLMVVLSYTLGLVCHIAADVEKTVVLSQCEKTPVVVKSGVWMLCRNPNYLGECGIYLALTVLVNHPVGWAIFCVQQKYWIDRMKKKDRHMLKKYGHEYMFYTRQTPSLYLPCVPSWLLTEQDGL